MDEQYRHECEVRDWISRTKGNHSELKRILDGVQRKRGKPAADRLRKDIWKQIKK